MSSSRNLKGVEVPIDVDLASNDNNNNNNNDDDDDDDGDDDDIDNKRMIVADQVNASTSNNSSIFRRWSRNLSAQRHKELNRLNQIERRRQFLELKRQNDLFDQMRVTVEAAALTSATNDADLSDAGSGSSAQANIKIKQLERKLMNSKDEIDLDNKKIPAVGQQQVLQLQRQLKQHERPLKDDSSTLPIKASNNNIESTSSLTKLRLTSPTRMSVHEQRKCNDEYNVHRTTTLTTTTNKIRSKDEERDNSSSPKLNLPAHANLSSSHSNNNNNNNNNYNNKHPPAPKAKLQQAAEAKVEASIRVSEQEQEEKQQQQHEQFNAGNRISGDLLARFVSQQVPKNKRVLCLIVRDKISRLNKAKSYFYPTYYLFIQTILDIDESGDFHHHHHQQEKLQLHMNGQYSESECNQLSCSPIRVTTNEMVTNQLVKSTSIDYNNSFSASSSISADMLFIGTTPKKVDNPQANGVRSIEMSGNSYSDIEVAYAGSEDEDEDADDYPSNAQDLNGLDQRRRKQHIRATSIKTANNNNHLQGRDSPLVFPNLDNKQESESAAGMKLFMPATSSNNNSSSSSSNGTKIKSTASLIVISREAQATSGSIYPAAHTTKVKLSGKSNEETYYDDEDDDESLHRTINATADEDDQETAITSSSSNLMRLKRKKKKTGTKTSRVDLSGDSLSLDGDADSNEHEGDELDSDNDDGDDNFHNQQAGVKLLSVDDLRKRKELTGIRWDYYEDTTESLFENDRNPYTGTNGVLLAGRRRKKAKTYLIGTGEFGYTRKNSICKLKSNVLGTQFNAIRLNNNSTTDNLTNDRCNIASINYETNVLGFKGPRKMRVFLAKDTDDGAKNLIELHKRNPFAVVHLKNMTPSWNIESQSYVLNFHGRVTQASVKNFQLVEFDGDNNNSQPGGESNSKQTILKEFGGGQRQSKEKRNTSLSTQQQSTSGEMKLVKTANSMQTTRQNFEHELHNGQQSKNTTATTHNTANNGSQCEQQQQLGTLDKSSMLTGNKTNLTYNSSIVMQFGRISNHEFTCDVTYPLSILQAFTIALSSFDSKLACE